MVNRSTHQADVQSTEQKHGKSWYLAVKLVTPIFKNTVDELRFLDPIIFPVLIKHGPTPLLILGHIKRRLRKNKAGNRSIVTF
jgi:hypothetical protein